MKNAIVFIGILMSYFNCVYAGDSDSLIRATKQLFEEGKKETGLYKNSKIKKKAGITKIPNCHSLRDDEADESFHEYQYIGEIGQKPPLLVIKKTLYNGEEYLLINNKGGCKVYNLLGKPHLSGSIIVNFNELETTDKKKIIEVWRVANGVIYKKKEIRFIQNLEFTDIRFGSNNSVILMDIQGRYWKFLL